MYLVLVLLAVLFQITFMLYSCWKSVFGIVGLVVIGNYCKPYPRGGLFRSHQVEIRIDTLICNDLTGIESRQHSAHASVTPPEDFFSPLRSCDPDIYMHMQYSINSQETEVGDARLMLDLPSRRLLLLLSS